MLLASNRYWDHSCSRQVRMRFGEEEKGGCYTCLFVTQMAYKRRPVRRRELTSERRRCGAAVAQRHDNA